uniref:TNFR-Cys domain-containing protein n=2 Tax=Macrostomum lignano TaxID=282301 RepID=A0A1I8HSU8_9PLAT
MRPMVSHLIFGVTIVISINYYVAIATTMTKNQTVRCKEGDFANFHGECINCSWCNSESLEGQERLHRQSICRRYEFDCPQLQRELSTKQTESVRTTTSPSTAQTDYQYSHVTTSPSPSPSDVTDNGPAVHSVPNASPPVWAWAVGFSVLVVVGLAAALIFGCTRRKKNFKRRDSRRNEEQTQQTEPFVGNRMQPANSSISIEMTAREQTCRNNRSL